MTDRLPSACAVLERPVESIRREVRQEEFCDSPGENKEAAHLAVAESPETFNMPSGHDEGMTGQHRGYVVESGEFVVASVLGLTDTEIVERALSPVQGM